MKTERLTLAVLGAGNMGGALCKGLVQGEVLPPDRIVVSDKLADRAEALAHTLGVKKAATNREAVAKADVIVLAVKPQDVDAVLADVGALITPARLLISICAGIGSAHLEALLPAGARVVRAMPNTPMLVGMGAVGLAAGRHARPADLDLARTLFAAAALVVPLADERLIDAVTAVSGSGPAYVFYLIEAMVAAGVAEGLTEVDAQALAARTVLGAATLLERTGEAPQVLRQRVTSPGGTTQAALDVLERARVRDLLVSAVRRAAERSRELGR
jgi:pyrroline-5-carboxylate reductase